MTDQLQLGEDASAPVEICRDAADDSRPCEFAKLCHENRQRLQSGMKVTGTGYWTAVRPPLRGMDCWAYQGLRARAARIERTKLAAGTATVADDSPAP